MEVVPVRSFGVGGAKIPQTSDPEKQNMKQKQYWNKFNKDFKAMCCAVLSHFSHVRLFATPWTVACQAPLSMGFSSQEHWSGLSCSSPGDLPDPGVEPVSLMSPALASEFITANPTAGSQDPSPRPRK